MAPSNYTAKDITVLEGLEPVRKRPGMYIGGVGAAGLHHLIWEVLDNSVDEAMNGHAAIIAVTLHADGSSITIEDDGRGIPIDTHPATKKSALEVIFTVLHAGGKFESGNYKTAGGLQRRADLVATVKRDGCNGNALQAGPSGQRRRRSGRRAAQARPYFHPAAIFRIEFTRPIQAARGRQLPKGVKVVLSTSDEKRPSSAHRRLVDYQKKSWPRGAKPVRSPFVLSRDEGCGSFVLQWLERPTALAVVSSSRPAQAARRTGCARHRQAVQLHPDAQPSPKGVSIVAEDPGGLVRPQPLHQEPRSRDRRFG